MLAMGRALMAKPRLLLLDEPSLGLSPVYTQEVGAVIKRISDEGLSILLIEQNASMALKLARTGYVLETGGIALAGSASRLQADEHVRKAYLGVV